MMYAERFESTREREPGSTYIGYSAITPSRGRRSEDQ